MATRRSSKTEEPDLLAEIDEPASKVDDNEEFDLLDELTEDNGKAWTPATDEDMPRGIQGRVTYVSQIEKDQEYGGGFAPMLEIQDREDPELVWSVRGYHKVLHNQIEKADPQVGDTIAIKYFGFKVTEPAKSKNQKDKGYENYKVVVRRAK